MGTNGWRSNRWSSRPARILLAWAAAALGCLVAPAIAAGAAAAPSVSDVATAQPGDQGVSNANPPRLTGVRSTVGGNDGSCALLASGGVDCWGSGYFGQLGDGIFYTSGHVASATPVQVVGVGGSGTLSGVASLTSDGNSAYCALLTSGGVDCWGSGSAGELGDGIVYKSGYGGSDIPVQVVGVGGSGTLSGVASLASAGDSNFCAVLTSGGVDCWGYNIFGVLGNGTQANRAKPVPVVGVGGSGTLSGVASLTSQGFRGDYCALLTSEAVDCWGYGVDGELGNGKFHARATPVQVVGVGGGGTLSGVASLTSDSGGFCAVLTSGGVDCWGQGEAGQLGDAIFYSGQEDYGSATPVQVVGVGGAGTLSGVASLATQGEVGYCALLTTGAVDCWGSGSFGQLGDGIFHTSGHGGSATPVQVIAVGGSGDLSGVVSLVSDGPEENSYCVLVASGGVDCWGGGHLGDLGNGTFYSLSAPGSPGSATPVRVLDVSGSGTLSSVASVTTQSQGGYCVVLTSGGADCWGEGQNGQLGNGTFYTRRTTGHYGNATPVRVVAVAGTAAPQ